MVADWWDKSRDQWNAIEYDVGIIFCKIPDIVMIFVMACSYENYIGLFGQKPLEIR